MNAVFPLKVAEAIIMLSGFSITNNGSTITILNR